MEATSLTFAAGARNLGQAARRPAIRPAGELRAGRREGGGRLEAGAAGRKDAFETLVLDPWVPSATRTRKPAFEGPTRRWRAAISLSAAARRGAREPDVIGVVF